MSDEQIKYFGLTMFPPISLVWNAEQQALDLRGVMMAGHEERPFLIQLHGHAVTQTLRAFRNLLDQVDEDALEAKTPSGLQ